jgi:hypothetical protein
MNGRRHAPKASCSKRNLVRCSRVLTVRGYGLVCRKTREGQVRRGPDTETRTCPH